MIKSPSSTDLPLLRWMEANGIEVADDTAAVLGMTRKLLSAMMQMYDSLDSKSQETLQDICMDMQKAMSFYLAEVEKEEDNG